MKTLFRLTPLIAALCLTAVVQAGDAKTETPKPCKEGQACCCKEGCKCDKCAAKKAAQDAAKSDGKPVEKK